MNYREQLFKCYDIYFEKYANQAAATLAHKKYVLDGFLRMLPDDVSDITTAEILNWQSQFNVAPNTLNGHLAILRQFLIFIGSQGLHTAIPILKKYSDDYVPYLFSQEDLLRLLEVADTTLSRSPVAATKTFCTPMILRLLACCGTRLGETLSLEWEDYDEVAGVLICKRAKGKKERRVPLHFTLNKLLYKYKYQFQRRYRSCKFLFPDNSLTAHITKQQFEYEFNKICLSANILPGKVKELHRRGVCVHCLRHTFAVNSFRKSLETGADITETVPVLSTYMGHERLQETEKYLKFSFDLFPDLEEVFGEYSSVVFEEGAL